VLLLEQQFTVDADTPDPAAASMWYAVIVHLLLLPSAMATTQIKPARMCYIRLDGSQYCLNTLTSCNICCSALRIFAYQLLQFEDDTAVLASKLSYTAATNGNSLATATPLATVVSGITATGTATGIVTQPGVADVFSFTAAAAGTATITGQVTHRLTLVNAAQVRVSLTLASPWFDSQAFRITQCCTVLTNCEPGHSLEAVTAC
jgi:hypothetical protein